MESCISNRSVWCLSTGRVGSQTVSALGDLSRRVDAYHEPSPSLYGLSRISYEMGGRCREDPVIQEAFRTVRSEALARPGIYLETSPQVTFLAPVIQSILPESRFVHIVRHPGAVVRSAMRRAWFSGNANDQWRIRPLEGKVAEQWHRYSDFEKNVWLWAETNRWCADFIEQAPSERCLTIRAEDVFAGSEDALQSLFAFAGVDLPRRPEIEAVLGRKLNRQGHGEFPSISSWSSEEREILERHAGGLLDRFSYSHDVDSVQC